MASLRLIGRTKAEREIKGFVPDEELVTLGLGVGLRETLKTSP